MKKKILCLAMTAFMVVGTTFTAHAEHFESEKDWLVSYTGDKLESNFKTGEMSTEILKLLPGDSMELQVKIQNTSEKEADWYMTNAVLETLEESKDQAEGGAYAYTLSYFDQAGTENVLYSSETVGGEDALENQGEGLHQATSSLEDYFYLDTLKKGEEGVVKLVVALDGETQGNDYQNTLARLAMNFAVEETGSTGSVTTIIKTGDSNNILLFSGLALASGLLLFVFALLTMREKRERKGEK